jgi:protoporphyrinogen oxidase
MPEIFKDSDMEYLTEAPAIVIGGGIAGLTAARTLQQQGQDFILLERCPTLGGLTRTVEVGEFCFDYTGHFLHLSRYPTPADIPYADLDNRDWIQVCRRSCCFVGGKLITAPIQYNLGELPPSIRAECVESYEKRPRNVQQQNTTFRDYIVNGFGERLADIFLIPQNEKTMAISLDRLSSCAVRRFFPIPDEALVRKGMRVGSRDNLGYNASFWYPRTGGISHLVEGLRKGVENCLVNQNIVAVDLNAKTLSTTTGGTFRWEVLFSSLPLKTLCQITGDEELIAASRELSHSSTISFNIGLRVPLRPEFQDIHWIYVPDRDIPFYRVGFYSNISKGTCTPGYSAIYVEAGMSPEYADRVDLVKNLQPDVLRSLEKLGWINRRDVVCVVAHTIRHAYVHHTNSRDRVVSSILDRLRKHNVHAIGRYGQWDYTSMEDSMESARDAVLEATTCNTQ